MWSFRGIFAWNSSLLPCVSHILWILFAQGRLQCKTSFCWNCLYRWWRLQQFWKTGFRCVRSGITFIFATSSPCHFHRLGNCCSLQGERKLKDFSIKDEAKDTNKALQREFMAHVDDNLLEIHFHWAGKGSVSKSGSSNGPLVAGISVTPSKKLHSFLILLYLTKSTGNMIDVAVCCLILLYSDFTIPGGDKLSTPQIVGISVGSVFAPILLLAFMWKMGWLGNRELQGETIF